MQVLPYVFALNYSRLGCVVDTRLVLDLRVFLELLLHRHFKLPPLRFFSFLQDQVDSLDAFLFGHCGGLGLTFLHVWSEVEFLTAQPSLR